MNMIGARDIASIMGKIKVRRKTKGDVRKLISAPANPQPLDFLNSQEKYNVKEVTK